MCDLEKIKSAVKDIVEYRSRNVMILGLEGVAGEYLRVKVTEVFEVLMRNQFSNQKELKTKLLTDQFK
jgi:hypothetical protein